MFVLSQVVQIVLWYLDSGCSRHMTGDRARLINFVDKFIGTVRFGNDEYAAIVGYGDYKLGDTIISRVYYVEGLKHNLFSVGQFYDGGLEVAFRQHSCHIRNYDMVDLLTGSHDVGISHEYETLYLGLTQNGVFIDRKTATELYGKMLVYAHLFESSMFLWAEAVATACYTLNRSLVHTLHGITMMKLLKGIRTNYNTCPVFGSCVFLTNDYDVVENSRRKQIYVFLYGYAPHEGTELELTVYSQDEPFALVKKEQIPPKCPPNLKETGLYYYHPAQWIFKLSLDEYGDVAENKARLVGEKDYVRKLEILKNLVSGLLHIIDTPMAERPNLDEDRRTAN
ncbi:hypothetical protein Tco_1247127 [Tanacetum coccineum]